MKRTQKLSVLFALLFIIGSSNVSFSQTIKDFFNNSSTPLTYLGIDYTKNRLINDPGGNASDIKSRLYASMNDVVVTEMSPKNYNMAGAFDRSSGVTSDISAVTENNEKISAKDIVSYSESDFNRLTESDIAGCVKGLGLKGKDGVGLVFIMEGMKKVDKKSYGAVWVTLIDMKTKKVLMTERMEQEAAGFGFRNFWVSIIKKTIIEIDKKKYKSWKSTYGG
ncbi:MAG: hypothetical protein IPL84_06725 [Chitinophagaceae bacterium]|nr:hypothetical protein [Chitinophagaceae bacterium]